MTSDKTAAVQTFLNKRQPRLAERMHRFVNRQAFGELPSTSSEPERVRS